jgi:hypothetical protein
MIASMFARSFPPFRGKPLRDELLTGTAGVAAWAGKFGNALRIPAQLTAVPIATVDNTATSLVFALPAIHVEAPEVMDAIELLGVATVARLLTQAAPPERESYVAGGQDLRRISLYF